MKQKTYRFFSWISYALVLAFIISFLLQWMLETEKRYELTMVTNETEEFRAMQMSEASMKQWLRFSKQSEISIWESLAIFMMISHMDLSGLKKEELDIERYREEQEYYTRWKEEEYAALQTSYEAVWRDLVYFPIPKSSNPDAAVINYADSWGNPRTYRDETGRHEGCDIMTSNNERGYFPVVSMTDGVVERIGWLEKGGYRIGIRSPHGGYFYYAHLYRYAQDFKEGDTIQAGQLLGFMGDSGYSKVEGTVGNFDVHLHLGIYIQTKNQYETSVNPYWVLKFLEESRLVFAY